MLLSISRWRWEEKGWERERETKKEEEPEVQERKKMRVNPGGEEGQRSGEVRACKDHAKPGVGSWTRGGGGGARGTRWLSAFNDQN